MSLKGARKDYKGQLNLWRGLQEAARGYGVQPDAPSEEKNFYKEGRFVENHAGFMKKKYLSDKNEKSRSG